MDFSYKEWQDQRDSLIDKLSGSANIKVIKIADIQIMLINPPWDNKWDSYYDSFILDGVVNDLPLYKIFFSCEPLIFKRYKRSIKPRLNRLDHFLKIYSDSVRLIFYLRKALVEVNSGSGFSFVIYDRTFFATFDSIIRISLSTILPGHCGMIIHSAAIADNDGVYLFCGRTGSGKSTIAKLAENAGWNVLGDELNVVRVIKDKSLVFSTPFIGTGGINNGYQMRKLISLIKHIKGEDVCFERLSSANGANLLIENCLYFANEDVSMRKLLEAVGLVTDQSPVFKMEFRKDTEFLKYLQKLTKNC